MHLQCAADCFVKVMSLLAPFPLQIQVCRYKCACQIKVLQCDCSALLSNTLSNPLNLADDLVWYARQPHSLNDRKICLHVFSCICKLPDESE